MVPHHDPSGSASPITTTWLRSPGTNAPERVRADGRGGGALDVGAPRGGGALVDERDEGHVRAQGIVRLAEGRRAVDRVAHRRRVGEGVADRSTAARPSPSLPCRARRAGRGSPRHRRAGSRSPARYRPSRRRSATAVAMSAAGSGRTRTTTPRFSASWALDRGGERRRVRDPGHRAHRGRGAAPVASVEARVVEQHAAGGPVELVPRGPDAAAEHRARREVRGGHGARHEGAAGEGVPVQALGERAAHAGQVQLVADAEPRYAVASPARGRTTSSGRVAMSSRSAADGASMPSTSAPAQGGGAGSGRRRPAQDDGGRRGRRRGRRGTGGGPRG